MQPSNHKIISSAAKKTLVAFVIITCTIFLNYCDPLKKQQRVNNKAFNIVVTNDTLLQQAAVRAEKSFGGRDTTNQLIQGKPVDSTTIGKLYLSQHPELLSSIQSNKKPQPEFKIDTAQFRTDIEKRIAQEYSDRCNELIKSSFDTGYNEGKIDAAIAISKLKIPIPPTDTLIKKVNLRGLMNIYEQYHNADQNKLSFKDGQIDKLSQDNKDLKKNNTVCILVIIGVIVTAILSHVVRSKISTIKLPKLF